MRADTQTSYRPDRRIIRPPLALPTTLPREDAMVAEATLWCPSCGAEYRPDATHCSDCRVALVAEQSFLDGDEVDDGSGLVELGQWPRVQAQVLRRRLETAGISVMIEWSGPASDATGIILVGEDQAAFGA